jgi:hypothetical protein
MSERRPLILVAPGASCRPHLASNGMAGWRESIHHSDPNISTVLGLAKERDCQKDEYRYRTILDGLALVFTIALMAAGIWPEVNIHGFSLHPRLSGPP